MTDTLPENLEQTVLRILREEILDADEELTPTTPLLETGLDSFSLTQLLLSIEEETDVWVDETYLTREHLRDVESLASCVREVAGQQNNEPE